MAPLNPSVPPLHPYFNCFSSGLLSLNEIYFTLSSLLTDVCLFLSNLFFSLLPFYLFSKTLIGSHHSPACKLSKTVPSFVHQNLTP